MFFDDWIAWLIVGGLAGILYLIAKFVGAF